MHSGEKGGIVGRAWCRLALLTIGIASHAFGGEAELRGGLTVVAQATASGDEQLLPDGRTGELSLSCDLLVKGKPADSVECGLHVEGSSGAGLDPHLGSLNLVPVNYDAGGDAAAALTEAWLSKDFGRGLSLTAGLLDVSTLFDTNRAASDETTQFLNASFRRSAAVRFPDGNAPCVRLAWAPEGSRVALALGWAETDADWRSVFADPYWFAELALLAGPSGERAALRAYWWSAGGSYTPFAGGADIDRTAGWGVSADLALGERAIVFARFGFRDDRVFEIWSSASAGVELSGRVWSRESDALGAAAALHLVSEDYADSTPAEDADMTALEVYYRRQVSKGLGLTVDLQVVWNYDCAKADAPLVLVGLRTQVSF